MIRRFASSGATRFTGVLTAAGCVETAMRSTSASLASHSCSLSFLSPSFCRTSRSNSHNNNSSSSRSSCYVALRSPSRFFVCSPSRPCWQSSSSSGGGNEGGGVNDNSDSTTSTSTASSDSSSSTRVDYTTRARGFGGKYAMAEKLAEAQERVQPLPPHLKEEHRCCAEGGDCDHHHNHRSSSSGITNTPPHAAGEPETEPTIRPILPAPLPKPISTQSVEEAAVRAAARAAAGGPVDHSIESLLVRSTLESIRSSSEFRAIPKGAAHRGIKRLLDYNKQWAVEVSRCNPTYFADLATEQKPEYLWIGCSDSRVPANEIVGLHPGDVFVHRNIGNIFSLSDLNCLSALQFAVDCLKVEHVIVAGHYKCGGVTAAMQGQKLGLTEHWIMQVTDIKNRWWHRVIGEIPEHDHLNVLCELNVLEQLYHVVSCCVIQRRWSELNLMESGPDMEDKAHILVRREYQRTHPIFEKNHPDTTARVFSKVARPVDVEVHGWVYSLDDGMLRPILRLTRHCNVEKAVNEAREAIFVRYSLST